MEAHEPHEVTADRLHRYGTAKTTGIGLIIGALGVVYGDIGTSPLYAISEIFFGNDGIEVTQEHALGAASLVFWSLVLVVTIKYVVLVMRANNEGEGGIFSMLGLLTSRVNGGSSNHFVPLWIITSVLIGAALLYGDGMITPAISVLSAVEGLKVANPDLESFVVPVTVGILAALFAIQKRGTHWIGWLFGPVMTVWFITIGALGIWHIVKEPGVLKALSPVYACSLLLERGWSSLHILGAVVLCVTGVEAMYADMGHFGRRAITRAWLFLVLPCLVLNYFGQVAYLLSGRPVEDNHVFYALAPSWGMVPMIILATIATIIASQALISGAFSLTQQATSLGLFPRLKVVHTNPDVPGQIYMPFINALLFIGCVGMVLHFRSSTNLAAAYGLAVTGTMTITTIVFGNIAIRIWRWSPGLVIPLLVLLLTVDIAFFIANLMKLPDGGYVTIMVGVLFFIMMDTWRWGRRWIGIAYQSRSSAYHMTVQELLEGRHEKLEPGRSMSLVVMASRPISRVEDTVPPALVVHYRNWHRIPKHIVFFSVVNVGTPSVPESSRFKVTEFLRDDTGTVASVQAYYGYMERPDIRRALIRLKREHRLRLPEDPRKWLILIGSERFVTRGKNIIERLRISLFSRMNRMAKPVTDYFGLQSDHGLTIETINV